MLRISYGNVWAKLEDAPLPAIGAVSKALSYRPEGYQFSRLYKMRRWNGWKTVYHAIDRTFPAGLAPDVAKLLTREGYSVEVVDTRVPPVPSLNWPELRLPKGEKLMEHQDLAVRRILQSTRGVVHHAVGAGKSVEIVEAVRRLGVPSLILTASKELLYQLHETFTALLDKRIGMIGDGINHPADVTVATIQTLSRNLTAAKGKHGGIDLEGLAKRQEMLDMLARFQGVHVDECKHVPSASYAMILANLPNAYYRIGYDATPLRGESDEQRLLVTGYLGPAIHQHTNTDNIEAGRAVPVDLFMIEPGGDPPEDGEHVGGRILHDYQRAVRTGIVENAERNEKIVKLAEVFGSRGPTIVLTERIEHGHTLRDMLLGRGHEEVK